MLSKFFEVDRWLGDTLLVMFGAQRWDSHEDFARGPVGGLVIWYGAEQAFVSYHIVRERDPISLMDCFRCAACGKPFPEYRGHCQVITKADQPYDARVRFICSSCVDTGATRDAILARNELLGFGHRDWQPGWHGRALTANAYANVKATPAEHAAELERMESAGGFKPTQPPVPQPSAETTDRRRVTMAELAEWQERTTGIKGWKAELDPERPGTVLFTLPVKLLHPMGISVRQTASAEPKETP